MIEADDHDTTATEGKQPARVTSTVGATRAPKPAKKAAAKKAPVKKAAAKKSPVKKSPVKKAAAKKSPAKKAPVKKASATKVPVKKAPAKKAAAKKAPVKKAAAKKAPVKNAPTEETAAPRSAKTPRSTGPEAITLSVTQGLLNDALLIGLGAGVPLDPLDTSVVLPGMGEVDVRLALTITSATLDLQAEDDGLARVVVTAAGEVAIRTVAADGVVEQSPAIAEPPAPIPVVVEALVRPSIEIDEEDHLHAGLSLDDAVLVSLRADTSAPTPDGVDAGAWTGVLAMFSMVFDVLGAGLFETLAEHVGEAGIDLGPTVGLVLRDLGVARGPAAISVSSGLMTVSMSGDSIVGSAPAVPVSGTAVGVGLADSVVDRIARLLLAQAAGNLPIPFDVEIDLGDQAVSGRIRQPRLLPEGLPDLRGTFHTEVRPRLAGGQLELSVQSAWVEFPSIVPSVFNRVSKRLGGLVALAPARVRFPATIDLPVIPDSPDGLPIRVGSLQVSTEGLGVVLELA